MNIDGFLTQYNFEWRNNLDIFRNLSAASSGEYWQLISLFVIKKIKKGGGGEFCKKICVLCTGLVFKKENAQS